MRFRPPSINLVESKQLEQVKPILQPLEPYSYVETPTGQSNINEYEIILQDVSKLSQSKKSFLQNERRLKVRRYLEKKRQRQYKVFVNKNKRKVAVERKRIMGRFISKVDQQKIDKAFNLYDSKNNLKIEGMGSVIEQNNLGYKIRQWTRLIRLCSDRKWMKLQ
ncbi:hypothetical protein pb186bvf_002671 [Paramecium bursaria]